MREFMNITRALVDENRVRTLLAATFRLANEAPVYSAALLLAYGIGHCAVIVAAANATELVQRILN